MADKPFNNPFGALQEKLRDLPEGPRREEKVSPLVPARAVVRMERKGRGGKEVTVVEQLGLGAADLERWLKALKGALGCGGAVEGATIVLQGDLRQRVPDLLTARGVGRVTIG